MANVQARPRIALKYRMPRILQYIVLSIVVVLVLAPIVILVFGSLKTRGEMYSRPYTIPNPAHWENYSKILTSSTFWTMLRNSFFVMLYTTAGVLIICSLAAFVFARLQFRGKSLAFNFLTLGLMFPITVAIMPVYLVIRQMGLTNNLAAVILVQTAFGISDRAAGCSLHRWLYGLRFLLAHPAAAGPPGPFGGGSFDHDHQLERPADPAGLGGQ
jgi:ABC-type glycerol-3-phosphate transport system permease component